MKVKGFSYSYKKGSFCYKCSKENINKWNEYWRDKIKLLETINKVEEKTLKEMKLARMI